MKNKTLIGTLAAIVVAFIAVIALLPSKADVTDFNTQNTGTSTVGVWRSVRIGSGNTQATWNIVPATTATNQQFSTSGTSHITLNANCVEATVFNTGTNALYVLVDPTGTAIASSSNFNYVLPPAAAPGGIPATGGQVSIRGYTGSLSMVTSGTGSTNVKAVSQLLSR